MQLSAIKGHADQETISHTNEVFPSFQSGTMSSNCMYNLSSTPTLKELDQYITDMAPFYYDIGLELDIVNSKLKLIKNNPSLPDLKEKCLKMLEVWLEADASATWRKLYDALQETGLSVSEQVLAEQAAKNVE